MFYSHGSIWDTFIKNIFFANFLQIHGSSWDTFIKKFPRKNKKLLCNYKKIIPATTTKSFSFTVFFFIFLFFCCCFLSGYGMKWLKKILVSLNTMMNHT